MPPLDKDHKEVIMEDALMYVRWFNFMSRLNIPVERLIDAARLFQKLHDVYTRKDRTYHNLRHIKMCLDELDGFRMWSNEYWDWEMSFNEVEFALWWHNLIDNNEGLSAERASESLKSLNLDYMADKVFELIKVGTDHKDENMVNKGYTRAEGLDPDGVDLIRDIDLAILGQPPKVFNDYERDVRQEYSHVSNNVFRGKRVEILQRFLERPRIYMSNYFYDKYEGQARENLKRSIAKLTSK